MAWNDSRCFDNAGGGVGEVCVGDTHTQAHTRARAHTHTHTRTRTHTHTQVRAPFTNMVPDFVVTGPDTRWKGVGDRKTIAWL